MTREEAIEEVNKVFEPAFANYIITALTEGATVSDKEPTTKNNLGVDWESYKDVDGNSLDDLILEVLQNNFDCGNTYGYKVADEIIGLLPSVTPQKSKTGYLSIDDVMSVFDDFMRGDADEEGTETFLEMLKDKAESEVSE